MKKTNKWNVLLVAVLFLSAFILTACSQQDASNGDDKDLAQEPGLKYTGQSLLVYSGAGLSKAMDEIGQGFEKNYGAKISFNYAGAAQLLSQMEINQTGDVFLGGSINDAEIAIQKGYTDKYYEVAYHIPAIAVPAGNPADIKELADLAKPGIKLILGDEQTNAIGKKGAKIFAKNNIEEGIAKNVVARDATVSEIVTHISMRQGDAALVWEDNGFNAKDIEIIQIDKEQNIIDKVPVCLLTFSENIELAQALIDYIRSPEGQAIFVKNGFRPME